jgi:hypothetical protein
MAFAIVAMAVLGFVAPAGVSPAAENLAVVGPCGDELCGQNHNQVLL